MRPTRRLAYPWRQTQSAASELGVTLQSIEVRDPKDIGAAFAMMAQERFDALIVLQDALTLQHRKEIIDFTIQKRLPGMFVAKEWVVAGGLMSYGESLSDMYHRGAYFVDKILKGASRRSARRTSHEVRAGPQPQDREGDGVDHPGGFPRYCRRRD